MALNVSLSPLAQEIYSQREWLQQSDILLLNTVAAVEEYLQANDTPYIVYDLETTGLDPETKNIVGVCLSYNPKQGVYIPVGHVNGAEFNLPWADLLPILQEHFSRKTVLMYNAKFDLGFSYYSGLHIPTFEDVMISVYMHDTNDKNIGLKEIGRRYLGIETIEITSLFPSTKKEVYRLF